MDTESLHLPTHITGHDSFAKKQNKTKQSKTKSNKLKYESEWQSMPTEYLCCVLYCCIDLGKWVNPSHCGVLKSTWQFGGWSGRGPEQQTQSEWSLLAHPPQNGSSLGWRGTRAARSHPALKWWLQLWTEARTGCRWPGGPGWTPLSKFLKCGRTSQ